MSRRQPPSAGSGLPQQTRQNEYFVPRDGIDREVITADICRYLGNDALVRPGNYENPENGQTIQGYYINAYRNLTSAMIQDLKADSARWDQERRQQSANRSSAGGGIIATNDVYIRSSNSPPVQYRNSDIHQSRQYYGPTEFASGGAADPYDAGPRYPGTGSGGYNGASGNYQAQPQYTTTAGGYPPQGYTQSAQFAPPGGVSFSPTPHTVSTPGFGGSVQDTTYNMVGANLRANPPDAYGNDPYAASRDPRGDPRDPRDQRVPVSTMAATRSTYSTAGPVPPQGYTATSQSSGYYQQGAPPNAAYAPQPQPADPFYGRARSDCLASPAGTAGFSATPEQQQYETTPAQQRVSGSSQHTQQSTSSSTRHRSERDSVERHADRHSDSRHTHRSHRTGR
ncbi:hypothetical protein F5Y16DRAFT_409867 [Xylariaceae sp. FL0255]|nr:hypothetical protein F5Y16DRAFT_409867 [Xylariaceae sp. FL0255]